MFVNGFARFASFMVVLSCCHLVQSAACTAAEPGGLPGGWRDLPVAEFVAQVQRIEDEGVFNALNDTEQNVIRVHGKTLFDTVNYSNSPLEYKTLNELHWLVFRMLDGTEIDRTRNAILQRQEDWAGQPYSEIKHKVSLMYRLDIPGPACIAEGRRWVQAGGTFAQVDPKDLSNEIVRQCFTPVKLIDRSFSVRWNGSLTATESGNYTFSISPINVNSNDPKNPVKIAMSVAVQGQAVLNATPENWVTQSTPVALTADDPAALQVTLSVDAAEIPRGMIHALLYWEGPGISKAIIPTSRLRYFGEPGLQAVYSWQDANGQTQSLTRIDRTVDFAWSNTPIYLSEEPEFATQVSDAMWENLSTDEFLIWCESSDNKVKMHPFIKNQKDSAAGLSSVRQKAFLDKLLARPALLDVMSPKDAVYFYQAFRFGSPEKALNVFGIWATRQADWEGGISNHPVFEIESRDAFHQMAICVTQQLPDEVATLQADYLELNDGRCCLPVAYTLAYSYLGRGQIDQWIALLQARLGDPSMTGDKRINWLLARAHAEEIRSAQPDPYGSHAARPLDGRGYLDEGLIVVESAALKIRVAREIVGRLVSTQQFDAAGGVLEQTINSVPEGDRAPLIATQQVVAALQTEHVQLQQSQTAAAQQAYLANLQKRRERASANGDTAAVERYDALINAAGGQ